jgi:hypothetical protein
LIAEKENVCYEFPFAVSGLRHKVDRWIGVGMRVQGFPGAGRRNEEPAAADFFIPNGHNPLKRLDSKK